MNKITPLVMASAVMVSLLAGCASNGTVSPQAQTAITILCAADALAPGVVTAGTAVAIIADPAAATQIQAANTADQAVHPAAVAACKAALPGSVPVAGTVAPVVTP